MMDIIVIVVLAVFSLAYLAGAARIVLAIHKQRKEFEAYRSRSEGD